MRVEPAPTCNPWATSAPRTSTLGLHPPDTINQHRHTLSPCAGKSNYLAIEIDGASAFGVPIGASGSGDRETPIVRSDGSWAA